nr:hypothetical protein [Tanacetum cinerariifolium]
MLDAPTIKGVGHNKASCENPSVPKPITIVKKVSGIRREPNVHNALARGGDRGSRGGRRGAMGAESGGRGQMGAKSGGRGGMGSGIRTMGTDSGGIGGSSGGKVTMGGARGGRIGGERGSTSGLNEKSPDLLSYWGFENFQPSAECPMKIHGKNIPTLDVLVSISIPLDQLKYEGN